MPQIKMKAIDGIGRKEVSKAAAEFMRRCRLPHPELMEAPKPAEPESQDDAA